MGDEPVKGGSPQENKTKSFAFQVTVAFILTAAMTAVLMAGVAFLVWSAGRGRFFGEQDLYTAMLIAAFISVLVAVIVGIYFANGIVAPVQRISNTVQAIKDGDYSARTHLCSDDEIGRLGQAFDEMADAMERDRELERQLIGDVAHELRTPLMAVQATVEAIQDGVFPADEIRLSTINAETRRLSRLVDALLHLNRLENGTIVAKIAPMNLSDALADLALNHQALIESAELSFDAKIDPEVRIRGDRDLISQATANLLSNAVRYTPEGGSVTLVVTRNHGDAAAGSPRRPLLRPTSASACRTAAFPGRSATRVRAASPTARASSRTATWAGPSSSPPRSCATWAYASSSTPCPPRSRGAGWSSSTTASCAATPRASWCRCCATPGRSRCTCAS